MGATTVPNGYREADSLAVESDAAVAGRRGPGTRVAEHGIRLGIVLVFLVGVRRRDPGAIANALVAFVLTFLPSALERRYDVAFEPWQRVYTEAAMLTHSVGMVGPYDDTWWWDHVTHTHSATILGALVHAVSRRRGSDPQPRVVGTVLGLGVLWELLEYAIHGLSRRLGVDAMLVPYGRYDTAFDLFFDGVGALVVLVFGDSLLRNFLPRDGG